MDTTDSITTSLDVIFHPFKDTLRSMGGCEGVFGRICDELNSNPRHRLVPWGEVGMAANVTKATITMSLGPFDTNIYGQQVVPNALVVARHVAEFLGSLRMEGTVNVEIVTTVMNVQEIEVTVSE